MAIPEARRKVDRFLARNGMLPRALSVRRCVGAYIREMQRGLSGAASSLAMIPTWIETGQDVPSGRSVIALDAGGTNLRVAVVRFEPGGAPSIEHLARHPMPGVGEEIAGEEFFRQMARAVAPVAALADRIGFCFSYPAEMQPDKDGRLIRLTKEIKARGVEGQLIGRNLAMALSALGSPAPAKVILLNDTVAALLAGRNSAPGRRFDGFIGFVCGTGMNAAYEESNAEIRKLRAVDPTGSQVINVEAGSFGGGPTGTLDRAFNAATADPGKARYEKMVSGLYLGGLCLLAAKQAAREGCLSSEAGRELDRLETLSTKDVNEFLLSPDSGAHPLGKAARRFSALDAQVLHLLLDSLVERAAMLAAITLCAVLLKSGRGRDPRYPVMITADGTTFWQLRAFRTRVESHMRAFLAGDRERAWEISGVDDAPLLGAGIAALTN